MISIVHILLRIHYLIIFLDNDMRDYMGGACTLLDCQVQWKIGQAR